MKFFWLALVGLVAWFVATPIVNVATDQSHWLVSAIAFVICLVPAIGTMVLIQAMERRGPVEAIGSVLVAPLLRLCAVAVLGVVAYVTVPELKLVPLRFLSWLSFCYLLTLVVETALLLPKKRLTVIPKLKDSPQP